MRAARVHAKVAVADENFCFVSSANLTGHAMEKNMEAGVFIRGGATPRDLHSHLEALETTHVVARSEWIPSTPQTRSRIMARVGQKDTGAEMMLRRALHREGLRYRLHDRNLPGSPDIVLPRFKAVIFVHGCYWHAHGCHRSTLPKSHREFWSDKFTANRARDERECTSLLSEGWRVLTVWECALRGKTALPIEGVAKAVLAWLKSSAECGEIGTP